MRPTRQCAPKSRGEQSKMNGGNPAVVDQGNGRPEVHPSGNRPNWRCEDPLSGAVYAGKAYPSNRRVGISHGENPRQKADVGWTKRHNT